MKIATNKETYEVIDYNVFNNPQTGGFELWITRQNGGTKCVHESESEDEIMDIKKALDKACEIGEEILRLYKD